MKKLSYILLFGVSLSLAASCTKVQNPEGQSESATNDVIYASYNDVKTAISGTGINSHAEWVTGDKVAVYTHFYTGTQIDSYEYTAQGSGQNVTFNNTGTIKKNSDSKQEETHRFLAAIWPRSAASDISCTCAGSGTNNPAVLNLSVSKEQDGSFSNIVFAGITQDFKPSSVTDKNKQFVFTAVSSILKLNVPSYLNAKAIYIESSNYISGSYNAKSSGGSWTVDNITGTSKTIIVQKISNNTPQVLSGDIYVSLLPSSTVSNISIAVVSDGKYGDKSNTISKLLSNTIVDLGTIHNVTVDTSVSRFQCNEKGLFIEFAKGNLQYRIGNSQWRIAEHQYDIVGGTQNQTTTYGNVYENGSRCTNNYNYSLNFDGYTSWIDLFGYGCTGYSEYSPTNTLATVSYPTSDLDENTDWGKYLTSGGRKIVDSDGNSIGTGWRTLSAIEWSYLYANCKKGSGKVNGVPGIILLPHYFVDPFLSTKPFSTATTETVSWGNNIYTANEWIQMENAGAVFLPKAGVRVAKGSELTYDYSGNYDSYIFYWTSTYSHSTFSRVSFNAQSSLSPGFTAGGTNGRPVRLVRDIPVSSNAAVSIQPFDVVNQ